MAQMQSKAGLNAAPEIDRFDFCTAHAGLPACLKDPSAFAHAEFQACGGI